VVCDVQLSTCEEVLALLHSAFHLYYMYMVWLGSGNLYAKGNLKTFMIGT
jgi:hypothetical protein